MNKNLMGALEHFRNAKNELVLSAILLGNETPNFDRTIEEIKTTIGDLNIVIEQIETALF